ncbi:type II toxin-antitoxin system RelE/ParE family toxin [Parapedobacter tibetensis]|uniref:type II toxin-antitoxin system RelE/ParE family toxin n=1 Tax=Parapedobacter tibetensis TaxID=2972951 RepID=UPI00356B646D
MPSLILFHPEAEKEYLKSIIWYEERLEGLGRRFERMIEAKIEAIAENPLHYPVKKKDFRECLTPIFPFLIVYKYYPKNNTVFIASIFHSSRKPSKKYRN